MSTRRAVFRIRSDESAEFTRLVVGRFLPPPCAREGGRREDTFVKPELSHVAVNTRRPSN